MAGLVMVSFVRRYGNLKSDIGVHSLLRSVVLRHRTFEVDVI